MSRFLEKEKPGRPGKNNAAEDDYDDFTLEAKEAKVSENVEVSKEIRKVEMNKLVISSDNQKLIREVLGDIRGQSFRHSEKGFYEDTGRRLEKHYWLEDRKLVVQGVTLPKNFHENVSEEDISRNMALSKLENYGFHTSYAEDALNRSQWHIGEALEVLIGECFFRKLTIADGDTTSNDKTSNDLSGVMEALLEQREDEKVALSSIYGPSFQEKVLGRVWLFILSLPHLNRFRVSDADEPPMDDLNNPEQVKLSKIYCPFLAKGFCRYGKRCYYSHQAPADDTHLREARQESENQEYTLEIRFPPGNLYPQEPPLVAFCANSATFPRTLSLKITQRLCREAKECASNSVPSIFSLISLLESEEEMAEVASKPDLTYSFHKQANRNQNVASNSETSNDFNQYDNGTREKVLDWKAIKAVNCKLRDRFREKTRNEEYRKFQEARQNLPAWLSREEIVTKVGRSQVVVISGMTGCGKSTQVPQYLLDAWLSEEQSKATGDHCNILVTQPRRISAMAVAERVAEERVEKIGNVVGYQIRLENKMSENTRMLFCTTGILLRRLESAAGLDDVTHVIVDEVHERSEESDFLILALRDLLPKRPDLRVILMSATLNAQLFSDYFGHVPVIEIPGRTFPVEQYFLEDAVHLTNYSMEENSPFARNLKSDIPKLDKEVFKGFVSKDSLGQDEYQLAQMQSGQAEFKPPKDKVPDEDLQLKALYWRYSSLDESVLKTVITMDPEKINYDLIERIVSWILEGDHEMPKEGSILVFLPGMAEITTLYEQLQSNRATSASKVVLVPLHSALSSEEQQRVFQPTPKGKRKIVLSTNIAETSVTIDDCVFVIDTGKMKEKRFDPVKSMESLDVVWTSVANSLQRKGRAGRVRPGYCFHLYTRHRYEHNLRKQPIPEIQRVSLERVILRIKVLPIFEQLSVEQVLCKLLEPPTQASLTSAINSLKDVGAMDSKDELTALGYHLAELPVDVRIGKLMLLGCIFRCVDSALTIAACLSYKSPFVSPFSQREQAQKKLMGFANANSDQLTVLKAYKNWQALVETSKQSAFVFAQENFLSVKTLQMLAELKQQYVELLSGLKFLPGGLSSRVLKRIGRNRADGVLQATGADWNVNGENYKVLASIICASLYPNIVKILRPVAKYKATSSGAIPKMLGHQELRFLTKNDGMVNVHPSSVCYQTGNFETPYLVYQEKIKTSRVFVRQVTMVPAFPLVLFGGNTINVALHRGTFVVSMNDGWIQLVCESQQVAELLQELRKELDQLLADKINDPSLNLLNDYRGKRLMNVIVKLITSP